MTLLVPNLGAAPAAGGFSIGSNVGTADSTMNMSLDDMIANRRKEAVRETRRGGRNRVSTADRSIATGRAKRSAAVNARRQITTTKKPTKMEVEKEVTVQVARSQKAKTQPKKGAGRVAATGGRKQRAATKAAGPSGGRPQKGAMKEVKTRTAAVQVAQASQPPTKKAVNAAVQAFRANGFQIPQGAQMVIRFEGAAKPPAKGRGNQGGGRNANSGGGRGGRGGANKNSNTRTNNNNNNNNNNGGGGRGRNSNNNRRGRGGRGGGGGGARN